jgi:hypothetical protein
VQAVGVIPQADALDDPLLALHAPHRCFQLRHRDGPHMDRVVLVEIEQHAVRQLQFLHRHGRRAMPTIGYADSVIAVCGKPRRWRRAT